MAGAYGCLASTISRPALAPLPWCSKTRTNNFQQTTCFLPPTGRFHGPKRYPSLRIATKLRRLDHMHPLKLARNFNKSKFSSSNEAFEFVDIQPIERSNNSSIKDEKKRISLVKKIANAICSKSYSEPWIVPWGTGTILLVASLTIAWRSFLSLKLSLLFLDMYTMTDCLCIMSDGLFMIAILSLCLCRLRPLLPDCFNFSLRGNWKLDVAIGCLLLPHVSLLNSIIDLSSVLVLGPPKTGLQCLELQILRLYW